MPSRTIENYLKQLYLEQARAPKRFVAMGRLAALVGVTAGTATTMVKAIGKSGLASYRPRGGVRLTPAGEQLALHVLRRHRLVELFLVEVLGIDWSDAHQEAEELEHVVSDLVLGHMDKLLGHPVTDPHGDPIPSNAGKIDDSQLLDLAQITEGRRVRIVRIIDQTPAFLRFAQSAGLVPKARVIVQRHNAQADAVTVRPLRKAAATLSAAVAEKFLVSET